MSIVVVIVSFPGKAVGVGVGAPVVAAPAKEVCCNTFPTLGSLCILQKVILCSVFMCYASRIRC